ncbi:hypothetical protein [Kribbella swartbergensis]
MAVVRGLRRSYTLVEQPDSHLLGKFLSVRAGRDDLAQVVAALRDRVDPGIHAHPDRAAGQHVEPPRSRFLRPFAFAMKQI